MKTYEWNRLANAINRRNLGDAKRSLNADRHNPSFGLNASWVSQDYEVLFKREYLKKGQYRYGYNVMRQSSDFKRGSEEHKKYLEERKRFYEEMGGQDLDYRKKTGYKGLEKIDRRLEQLREEEISPYDTDFKDYYKKGATEWTSKEWDIANEFMKNGIDSKTAIEMAYAIINEDNELFAAKFNNLPQSKKTGTDIDRWIVNASGDYGEKIKDAIEIADEEYEIKMIGEDRI